MPTIVPKPGEAADTARRLLELAGDQPQRVRTVTTGPSIAFDVDDDLAKKLGGARKPRKTTAPQAPAAEVEPPAPEQPEVDPADDAAQA